MKKYMITKHAMLRAVCVLVLAGGACGGFLTWRQRMTLAPPERQQRPPAPLNLNESFFPALMGYGVGAEPVKEEQYPWAARLVHSRSGDFPQICTAVCIDERIFITAARCINFLKVNYTSIIQMNIQHPALAFVLPSNSTKMAFDDIGLVVVEPAAKAWPTVPLTSAKRTDEAFRWFEQLNLSFGPQHHKVVGYVCAKEWRSSTSKMKKNVLSELDVIVSISLCSQLLTRNYMIQAFNVPCYHSCSANEFPKQEGKCKKYLGVEGGAVIDVKTRTLLGIATWGPTHNRYELPVGFAVPNSNDFFSDLSCARKIRDDKSTFVAAGHYQMLCDL